MGVGLAVLGLGGQVMASGGLTAEEIWRFFKATDEKMARIIELKDRRCAELVEA